MFVSDKDMGADLFSGGKGIGVLICPGFPRAPVHIR